MIRFVCGHCGRSVQVPASYAGKKGRCPYCGALLDIPYQDQPDLRVQARQGAGAKAPSSAARAPADERHETAVPPPPPPPHSPVPATEDLTIEELEQSSEDTAEMPAIQAGGTSDKTAILQGVNEVDKTPRPFHVAMRARTRRHTLLLILAITAAITAGVAIIALLTR